MLKKSQIVVLAIGGSLTLAFGAFYVIKDKTTFWLSKPLYCQEFLTADKRHPGKMEVCINGVHQEFSRDNGDAELHITFLKDPRTRVQAEGLFWLADEVGGKKVDYTGEINWHRIRTYVDNILVEDNTSRQSAFVEPVVPPDVVLPMWHWSYSLRYAFDREILPLEDKFDHMIDKIVEGGSVIGTAGLTIYKFFHATRG